MPLFAMSLSACILIFHFSPPSVRWDPSSCQTRAVGLGMACRRADVLLSPSRENAETAQWTNPSGSAEALQSSLRWHLLSWSTQGPQEAAAKWAVVRSVMYLLPSRLQAARKKDCPWPHGRPDTSLPCLPCELEHSHPWVNWLWDGSGL